VPSWITRTMVIFARSHLDIFLSYLLQWRTTALTPASIAEAMPTVQNTQAEHNDAKSIREQKYRGLVDLLFTATLKSVLMPLVHREAYRRLASGSSLSGGVSASGALLQFSSTGLDFPHAHSAAGGEPVLNLDDQINYYGEFLPVATTASSPEDLLKYPPLRLKPTDLATLERICVDYAMQDPCVQPTRGAFASLFSSSPKERTLHRLRHQLFIVYRLRGHVWPRTIGALSRAVAGINRCVEASNQASAEGKQPEWAVLGSQRLDDENEEEDSVDEAAEEALSGLGEEEEEEENEVKHSDEVKESSQSRNKLSGNSERSQQLVIRAAADGLQLQTLSFGSALLSFLDPANKQVTAEQAHRFLPLFTFFWLDLSCRSNLDTATLTLDAFYQLFTKAKGDKSRSVLKRSICHAIHNVLWGVAEQELVPNLDYSRWFSLLVSVHAAILEWAERKKTDWLVAMPALTALVCASPKENFIMNFGSLQKTLIRSYAQPSACVTALRCAQRVLFIYLTRVSERLETTVSALKSVTGDIVRAAHSHSLLVSALTNEDKSLTPAATLSLSPAQKAAPASIRWIFGSAETEDALLSVVATVAAWSPMRALELLVLPLMSLPAARGAGVVGESPTKQDAAILSKITKLGGTLLMSPISNEVVAVGLRALNLVLGGRNATLPLLYGISSPRISGQALKNLLSSVSMGGSDPLLPHVIALDRAMIENLASSAKSSPKQAASGESKSSDGAGDDAGGEEEEEGVGSTLTPQGLPTDPDERLMTLQAQAITAALGAGESSFSWASTAHTLADLLPRLQNLSSRQLTELSVPTITMTPVASPGSSTPGAAGSITNVTVTPVVNEGGPGTGMRALTTAISTLLSRAYGACGSYVYSAYNSMQINQLLERDAPSVISLRMALQCAAHVWPHQIGQSDLLNMLCTSLMHVDRGVRAASARLFASVVRDPTKFKLRSSALNALSTMIASLPSSVPGAALPAHILASPEALQLAADQLAQARAAGISEAEMSGFTRMRVLSPEAVDPFVRASLSAQDVPEDNLRPAIPFESVEAQSLLKRSQTASISNLESIEALAAQLQVDIVHASRGPATEDVGSEAFFACTAQHERLLTLWAEDAADVVRASQDLADSMRLELAHIAKVVARVQQFEDALTEATAALDEAKHAGGKIEDCLVRVDHAAIELQREQSTMRLRLSTLLVMLDAASTTQQLINQHITSFEHLQWTQSEAACAIGLCSASAAVRLASLRSMAVLHSLATSHLNMVYLEQMLYSTRVAIVRAYATVQALLPEEEGSAVPAGSTVNPVSLASNVKSSKPPSIAERLLTCLRPQRHLIAVFTSLESQLERHLNSLSHGSTLPHIPDLEIDPSSALGLRTQAIKKLQYDLKTKRTAARQEAKHASSSSPSSASQMRSPQASPPSLSSNEFAELNEAGWFPSDDSDREFAALKQELRHGVALKSSGWSYLLSLAANSSNEGQSQWTVAFSFLLRAAVTEFMAQDAAAAVQASQRAYEAVTAMLARADSVDEGDIEAAAASAAAAAGVAMGLPACATLVAIMSVIRERLQPLFTFTAKRATFSTMLTAKVGSTTQPTFNSDDRALYDVPKCPSGATSWAAATGAMLDIAQTALGKSRPGVENSPETTVAMLAASSASPTTSQSVVLTLAEQPDALLITMRNTAALATICCICDVTMHARGNAHIHASARARKVIRAVRTNRSRPGTPTDSRPGTPASDRSRPSTPVGPASDRTKSSQEKISAFVKEMSFDPAAHAKRGSIPLAVSPLDIRDNFGILQDIIVLLLSPIAPIRRIASTALGSIHPLGVPVLMHGLLDLERALYGASVFEGLPLYAHNAFGDNAVAAANALKMELQAQALAHGKAAIRSQANDFVSSPLSGDGTAFGGEDDSRRTQNLNDSEMAEVARAADGAVDKQRQANSELDEEQKIGEDEGQGSLGLGDLNLINKAGDADEVLLPEDPDEPTFEERMRAAGIPSDPTGGVNLSGLRALIRASGLGRPSNRRHNDEVRVAIAHVYRLIVESIDSAFLLLNPHANARIFIFIQETYKFFAHIGHEFRWDLLGLRVNYCATVRKLALGALAPVTIEELRADAELIMGFDSRSNSFCEPREPGQGIETPTLPAGDLLGGAITRCDPKALAAAPETNVSHIPLSLTSDLRRTLFEFFIAWCGHGPSSAAHAHKVAQHRDELLNRIKAKDKVLKQSLRNAFEEQMNLVQIAALHAMAALVAAPNFDRAIPLQLQIINGGGTLAGVNPRGAGELSEEAELFFDYDNSSSPSASSQASEAQTVMKNSAPGLVEGSVFEWLNATLTSTDPTVRDIGYLALHMFLCANPGLLPVFIAQCYSSHLVASRRYFLVVARVLIQGAELERLARIAAKLEATDAISATRGEVINFEEEEYGLSLIDDEYDSLNTPQDRGVSDDENDEAKSDHVNPQEDDPAEADRRALLRVLRWSAEAASGGRAQIMARVAAAAENLSTSASKVDGDGRTSALQAVGSVWSQVPLEIIANLALSKVADASYAVRSMALRLLPRVEIRVTRKYFRPQQFYYHHHGLQRDSFRNRTNAPGKSVTYFDALSSTAVDATRYALITSRSSASAMSTQRLWAARIASLHPDFALPFISEVCKRLRTAPTPASEVQMLGYMVPFVSRVVLSSASCPHSSTITIGSAGASASLTNLAMTSKEFLRSHTFLTATQSQRLLAMLIALTLNNEGRSNVLLDTLWTSLIQACFLPVAHFAQEQSSLSSSSSTAPSSSGAFPIYASQIPPELALVTAYPSYEDAIGQTLHASSSFGYKIVGGTGVRSFNAPGCTKRAGAELRNAHVIIEFILQAVPARLNGKLSSRALQACRTVVMCASRNCQLFVLHALSLEIAPNRLYDQANTNRGGSSTLPQTQDTADVFSLVYTSTPSVKSASSQAESQSVTAPYEPGAFQSRAKDKEEEPSYYMSAKEALSKIKDGSFKAMVRRPEDDPSIERYTARSAPALGLLDQTLVSSSTLAFVLLVDAIYEFNAAPALQAAQDSTAIASFEVEQGPAADAVSSGASGSKVVQSSVEPAAFMREPSPLEVLVHAFHIGVQALAGHNKSVVRYHAAALLLNAAHALFLLPALSEDDPVARAARHLHRSTAYTRFSPKGFLGLCSAVEQALANPQHESLAPIAFASKGAQDESQLGTTKIVQCKPEPEYIPQLLLSLAEHAGFSRAAMAGLWSHLALRWATVVRRTQARRRALAVFRAVQGSFQPSAAPILFDLLSAVVVPPGSTGSSGSSRLAFEKTQSGFNTDRFTLLEAQALADREDLANAAEVVPGPESMAPALTSLLQSAGNFSPTTDWLLLQDIVLSIHHAISSIEHTIGPWMHTAVASKPGVFTHSVARGYCSQAGDAQANENAPAGDAEPDQPYASPEAVAPGILHSVLVPAACPFSDDPSAWPEHLLSSEVVDSDMRSLFLPSVPVPSDPVLSKEYPLTISRAAASLRCVASFIRTALWCVVGLLRLDLLPGDVESGRGALQTPVYRGVFLESTKLFLALTTSPLLSAEALSSSKSGLEQERDRRHALASAPIAVVHGYVTPGLFASFAQWVQWNAVYLPGPVAAAVEADTKVAQVTQADSESKEQPQSSGEEVGEDLSLPMAFTGMHALLLRGLWTLDLDVRHYALSALIALWTARPAILSLADVSMFVRGYSTDPKPVSAQSQGQSVSGEADANDPNDSYSLAEIATNVAGLPVTALLSSAWKLSPRDVPRTASDWSRALLPVKRIRRYSEVVASMLRHSPAPLVLALIVPYLHASLLCEYARASTAASVGAQLDVNSKLSSPNPGAESAFSVSFTRELEALTQKPRVKSSYFMGDSRLSVLPADLALALAGRAAQLASDLGSLEAARLFSDYAQGVFLPQTHKSQRSQIQPIAAKDPSRFLIEIGKVISTALSKLDSGLAAFNALKSEMSEHLPKPSTLAQGSLPSFILTACAMLVESLDRQVHDYLIAELVAGALPVGIENSVALIHPGIQRVLVRILPRVRSRTNTGPNAGILQALSNVGIQTRSDLEIRVRSLEQSILTLDSSILALFLLLVRNTNWRSSGLADPAQHAPMLYAIATKQATLFANRGSQVHGAEPRELVMARALGRWTAADSVLACSFARIDQSSRSRLVNLVQAYTQHAVGATLTSSHPHPPMNEGATMHGRSLYTALEIQRLAHLSEQLAVLTTRQQAVLQRRSTLAGTSVALATPLYPLLATQGAFTPRPLPAVVPEAQPESDVAYEAAHAAAAAGLVPQSQIEGPDAHWEETGGAYGLLGETSDYPAATEQADTVYPTIQPTYQEGKVHSTYGASAETKSAPVEGQRTAVDGCLEAEQQAVIDEEQEEEEEEGFQFSAQLKPDDFEDEKFLAYFEDSPESTVPDQGEAVAEPQIEGEPAQPAEGHLQVPEEGIDSGLDMPSSQVGLTSQLNEVVIQQDSGVDCAQGAPESQPEPSAAAVLPNASAPEQQSLVPPVNRPNESTPRRPPPPVPRRPPPPVPTSQLGSTTSQATITSTPVQEVGLSEAFSNTQSVIRGPSGETPRLAPRDDEGLPSTPALNPQPSKELDVSLDDESKQQNVYASSMIRDDSDDEYVAREPQADAHAHDDAHEVYPPARSSNTDHYTSPHQPVGAQRQAGGAVPPTRIPPQSRGRNPFDDDVDERPPVAEEDYGVEVYDPTYVEQYNARDPHHGTRPVHAREPHYPRDPRYDDYPPSQQHSYPRNAQYPPSDSYPPEYHYDDDYRRPRAPEPSRGFNQESQQYYGDPRAPHHPTNYSARPPAARPIARESMDARIVAMLSQDDDQEPTYDDGYGVGQSRAAAQPYPPRDYPPSHYPHSPQRTAIPAGYAPNNSGAYPEYGHRAGMSPSHHRQQSVNRPFVQPAPQHPPPPQHPGHYRHESVNAGRDPGPRPYPGAEPSHMPMNGGRGYPPPGSRGNYSPDPHSRRRWDQPSYDPDNY